MIARFVAMGVAGCGKSSIGARFAAVIGADFVDGDDLHPAANIAKMTAGLALNDRDRAPWLVAVGMSLAAGPLPKVIACSALKRIYRDTIRQYAGGQVAFLYLDGARTLIAARMAAREGHFMPLALLDSQFAALQPPGPDEVALRVSIDQPPHDIVQSLLAGMATLFGTDSTK